MKTVEGRPAFMHYVRWAEGKFKRLAARKYTAFVRGDEAIERGTEPDVKIATVMFTMEGRQAVSPPERVELVRFRVHSDGFIDGRQVMDRVAALLSPEATDGNLIRAERRFHERAARWQLTELDRDALLALATRDAGFDQGGNRRQRRTKPSKCYVVRFQFYAFTGTDEVDGHFEAIVRATSQRDLNQRAREFAEEERSRGHIPWEAKVEMTFVAAFAPSDLTTRRTISLGGSLYVHSSGPSQGVEWPPSGDVRDDEEPVVALEPTPLAPRRASVAMRKVDDPEVRVFWVVEVTNLPRYPYKQTFYRDSEGDALKLTRALERRLAKPLKENPKLPLKFSRK